MRESGDEERCCEVAGKHAGFLETAERRLWTAARGCVPARDVRKESLLVVRC